MEIVAEDVDQEPGRLDLEPLGEVIDGEGQLLLHRGPKAADFGNTGEPHVSTGIRRGDKERRL